MSDVVPLQRRTIQDGLRSARVSSEGNDPVPGRGCVGLVSPVCTCGNRFGPFETRALDGSLNLAPLVQRPKPRWKKRRPKVIPIGRASRSS